MNESYGTEISGKKFSTIGPCSLFGKNLHSLSGASLCIIQSQGDLDGVLPNFSRSLKINMAAAIGVHLGYTCASLAIYKVENQLL